MVEPIELHPRELQVLQGMSYGLTNARIADRLHLTEDTIKTYSRRLFRAINARDRAHAVRRGFELGLLGPDQDQSRHPPVAAGLKHVDGTR
jgi:DNA-binding NarL/FixJ family response regulator